MVVGDQAATKPRSLVNMLLLSLRALLSHPTTNAESLHALLRCVVEVAWRQCRSHLPQPAAFSMERKRDKESRNAVSVPHFHILLLDLLQSVCCQLSRRFSRLTPSAAHAEMHAAALQALETVLETSASDCEFSLTNESVLFRYCRDLIALIGAMPRWRRRSSGCSCSVCDIVAASPRCWSSTHCRCWSPS